MNATIRRIGNDFEVVKNVMNSQSTEQLAEMAREINQNANKAEA